jgi:hypothetical protein
MLTDKKGKQRLKETFTSTTTTTAATTTTTTASRRGARTNFIFSCCETKLIGGMNVTVVGVTFLVSLGRYGSTILLK